jgi:hypothetical protein
MSLDMMPVFSAVQPIVYAVITAAIVRDSVNL